MSHKKDPAQVAETRKRLARTAAELAKLRPACDYCNPDIEITVNRAGPVILADLHHELGCLGRPDHGGHHDNLLDDAQVLDDLAGAEA